ncbi:MAG: exo-alpha-sialidase [Verrucomicrobia bacterium]|nr:exo-alpha-sialidase [Verrucomicrobiota bacterium]
MRRSFRLLAAAVFASALGAAEFPPVFRKVLRRQGDDGVHTYRIPGLATTKAGTLLAVFDIRHASAADLPGDIDVGAMRSTDGGLTWSAMRTILDFDKTVPGARGNGVGDPCVVADRVTGAIFVAALWSQGDRGWAKSGPGLSPVETGQFVVTKSTDDGLTWSPPINLTSQIKNPHWRLFFDGPGAGIQLRDGTLVLPAQFRDASGAPHSCFIWSADHGATWKISPSATDGTPTTNEAQIAQLGDGSLLLSMRDTRRSGQRAWARFEWTGDLAQGRWGKPWHDVPDPTCAAGLVRHAGGVLVFSNPASATKRVAMTVRASRDDGRTWNAGRLIEPGPSAYSCLTVLADGRIGLLYESGGPHACETITFAAFPLDWVLAAPAR